MKPKKYNLLDFKSFFIIIVSLLFITGQNTFAKNNETFLFNKLEQLVEKQKYFELKSNFEKNFTQLDEKHFLYFSAIVNNVFNKAENSNKNIQKLLNLKNTNISDEMLNKIYNTKLLNHINLYEYANATNTSAHILNNYKNQNTIDEIETLENEIKIWKALSDTPAQKVIKQKDTKLPMVKDKVGLSNVEINFNGITKPFLFDTGANFSVLVRSLVDELNLKYIDVDFYVTAATGSKVKSGIAIAQELDIHGIIVKNAVFLVLDDKDMSFPQVDYYPNGAIGFPVLEAMQELHFNQKDYIFIPKNLNTYNHKNFALDGLMPIVAVDYKNETLSFNLDTGATKTSLFPNFYKKYKPEIELNNQVQTLNAASAGGIVEFQGYSLNNLLFSIAESETKLNNIRLHTEDIGGEKSNFYGNLGQDFIKQYDEMIISFKDSSVLFN